MDGVQRNDGHPGARYAPESIRKELYKIPLPIPDSAIRIFDLGDIRVAETLKNT
jgi:hypothetical protein